MGLFDISHPGRHGVERIEAEDAEQAIETFRAKYGKIQTNHEYTVVDVTPENKPAPVVPPQPRRPAPARKKEPERPQKPA